VQQNMAGSVASGVASHERLCADDLFRVCRAVAWFSGLAYTLLVTVTVTVTVCVCVCVREIRVTLNG